MTVKTLHSAPVSGRTATYVVAASDAPAHVKAQADYVCDGTADNVEIQAAIDALPAGGGQVLLSSGQFNTAATIVPRQGLWLTGQRQATMVRLANGSNTTMFAAPAEADDVVFEDFDIDGNKANNASGHGIDVTNFQRCIIEGVHIQNSKQCGIYGVRTALEGFSVTMDDMTVSYAGGAGIYFKDWNVVVAFKRVVIELGDSYGLYMENCVNPYLLHVDTGGNTDWGFYFKDVLMVEGVKLHSEADKGAFYFNGCDYSLLSEVYAQENGLPVDVASANTIFYETESYMFQVDNLFIQNSHDNAIGLGIWYNQNKYFANVSIRLTGAGTTAVSWETTHARIGLTNVQATTLESRGAGGVNYKLVDSSAVPVLRHSGIATVLNTTTSIVVNHNMSVAPTRVIVTPAENPTNPVSFWWVDTITATQFTIHVNADPEASNLDFYWDAMYENDNL